MELHKGDVVTTGIFHRSITTISEPKLCTTAGLRSAQLYYQLVLVSQWVAAMVLLFLRHPAFPSPTPSSSPSPGEQFSNASSEQELNLGLSRRWLRAPSSLFNYRDLYLNPNTYWRGAGRKTAFSGFLASSSFGPMSQIYCVLESNGGSLWVIKKNNFFTCLLRLPLVILEPNFNMCSTGNCGPFWWSHSYTKTRHGTLGLSLPPCSFCYHKAEFLD